MVFISCKCLFCVTRAIASLGTFCAFVLSFLLKVDADSRFLFSVYSPHSLRRFGFLSLWLEVEQIYGASSCSILINPFLTSSSIYLLRGNRERCFAFIIEIIILLANKLPAAPH